MKVKKEHVILILIIVVSVLYLLYRKEDRTQYEFPKFPEVAVSDISKIEIARQGANIVLSKRDDKWYIDRQEYLANSESIKSMLDIIKQPVLTALVSESKDYYRYDLTDDKKINVKAWAGNTQNRDIDVGKTASSYRHTYVKLANDFRVYHVQKNLRDYFDKTVDELRDKIVLSFNKNDVQEIHAVKDSNPIDLVAKEGPKEEGSDTDKNEKAKDQNSKEKVWESADGKALDKTKLEKAISTLSELRCKEYLYDKGKDDLVNPIYTLRLKGSKEYTLSIFAKSDEKAEDYPAISSENGYPFSLIGWQADIIMADPRETSEKKTEDGQGGVGS